MFVGLDFDKHVDYSAIAILQKTDSHLQRVCLKEFELKTPYKHVIGCVRRMNDAYHFTGGCLDQTGVGRRKASGENHEHIEAIEEETHEKGMGALRTQFPPEFLNWIDEVKILE